ncbi:hypothetical protein L3X38_034105 [Prunus dulcis]|uniref:DUF4216 domain-containing protein n=1 Tax=Prunus dulcis TaxID=3755 RepID=A0AAD4VIV2_PRUDU|nr:hypothetical protein L3X38_034105 [Prunus dulcis]
MDKSWMHSDRRSKAYEFGVEAFLNFAVENLLTTTHIRCPCVKIPVFRCDWIDSSGLVVDELGFTLVDLSKIGHRNDQFVLASQVKQIFFVDDPMHRGWSVVLSMPNREYNDVIGDEVLGDVIIDCEPFTRGMPNVDTFDELVGELGGQNIRDGCEDIWIE